MVPWRWPAPTDWYPSTVETGGKSSRTDRRSLPGAAVRAGSYPCSRRWQSPARFRRWQLGPYFTGRLHGSPGGLAVNPYDRATFYTVGARGYTDYPFPTLT